MRSIFKNVIETGNFELSDMIKKIDTKWAENSISDDERTQLIQMARDKAIPENSFANADKRFEELYKEIADVKASIANVLNIVKSLGGSILPDVDISTESTDEYPEYKAPTGAHDAYSNGAKVTYNGVKYICVAPDGVAVVWNPDVMPSFWEIVE